MSVKSLLQELKISILATLAFAVALCGVYPFAVWGVAQLAFPRQANGSLVMRDKSIVGSSLIAQAFKGDRYFHPRPSAAGADGYDATSSGGSNLGPLSQKLMEQVKERAEAYRSENGLAPGAEVPADAVTASGSGLDPHISLENARIQTSRIAKARNLPEESVRRYVLQCVEGPQFGFLGHAGVNVLQLNLALDGMKGESGGVR